LSSEHLEYTYTRSFETPGEYSCYITTYNDYGLADSKRIFFTIYDKKVEFAEVYTERKTYLTGEDVVFYMTSDTGNCYTIGIDDMNGERIITYDTGTSTSQYTYCFMQPGEYSSYITAYNECGLADSKRIYLYITNSMMETADCVLPQRLKHIENEAFLRADIKTVVCPDSLETIGSKAFAECDNLRQIFIPKNTLYIADDAFVGCDLLVMWGETGSVAEQYANKKGILFVGS